MSVSELASWSVILGLALMLVGGLVLWAYGARRSRAPIPVIGPEAEATQQFHTRLVRWFFVYGVTVIVIGLALLFWGGSIFI
jgi:sterol desaturase/sphingolipid hydroxylase (fatty acid hydroxylase superfamily)